MFLIASTKYVATIISSQSNGAKGTFNMTVSDAGIGTYEWNIDLSGFKSGIATCDAAFIQTNGLKCKNF